MYIPRLKCLSVLVGLMAYAGIAMASAPAITQRIEPSTIDLGEASRLTIAESGAESPEITPPMVNGLEFLAVAQSERVKSVNGVTTSTKSVTYQVIPREAGVYTIPGAASGTPPVVLTVNPGSAGSGALRGSAAAQTAQVASGVMPMVRADMNADGSAFVRLHLAKHELYVGETIPVDIEVGMRDGFVASINGIPSLNGDEFTLNKLSSDPQKTEDIIDGKPFTILTWHSALAAVKPGTLSLTMETPLTVRMRNRPEAGSLAEAGLDDFFKDPMFQNFFGTSTEREITVASKPARFTVLALPTRDQPADFSGAIGHFTVDSDLSDEKTAVGEPLTLRMRISGTGNFDRVSSPMLRDVAGWKTYAPTANFNPSDSIGYRGVKTFEQPVIATQPGAQSLPPLTFSWFDPSTRQYAQARTSPLAVDIAPAAKDSSVAHQLRPQASPSALAQGGSAPDDAAVGGLRADHVVNAGGAASMTPYYYQPEYLGVPSTLLLALSGVWFWQRRREHASAVADSGCPSLDPQPLLNVMDDASIAGNPDLFFKSARAALQRDLASKWHLTPEAITPEEIDARLGPNSDVARLFMLAEETAYAGVQPTALDYQRWKQFVVHRIKPKAMS